ncbi:cag pathogenicity island Cag12 family protein [Pantoea agglomerans]|uniref:cag pathogenicity island Cag12 family protein n=1 Tax=Enterobacter agglomerans TaxID=549 RepID=UPI000DAC8225|nr:Cag pathogenicity island protein Cag12 [Pantoea agglomerans]TGX88206.1 Cag pathogenicity island protein Cag12 [Pantoea agglomerans]
MRCFNAVLISFCCTFLFSCGSPPQPPSANEAKSEVLNANLPEWKPNNLYISSPVTKGDWYLVTRNFTGSGEVYSPSFWYGLLHSQRIIVASGKDSDWFAVKNWLRSHGAKQVIEYKKKPLCNYCTDVYMINSDLP